MVVRSVTDLNPARFCLHADDWKFGLTLISMIPNGVMP